MMPGPGDTEPPEPDPDEVTDLVGEIEEFLEDLDGITGPDLWWQQLLAVLALALSFVVFVAMTLGLVFFALAFMRWGWQAMT